MCYAPFSKDLKSSGENSWLGKGNIQEHSWLGAGTSIQKSGKNSGLGKGTVCETTACEYLYKTDSKGFCENSGLGKGIIRENARLHTGNIAGKGWGAFLQCIFVIARWFRELGA